MTRAIPPKEQGAALINVLVLVGGLAALSTTLFDRLRLARHLDATRTAVATARGAGLAGETMLLARLPLKMLPAQAFALPTPAGPVRVSLRPGGNCLNLNAVVTGPAGQTVTRPLGVEQLARLLIHLDVPADDAARIAAATADWIDVDQQPGVGGIGGGAEDPAYARAATPYRTAGTLMAEVSEWRAVAGVTPAIFARAAPHLCALPVAELSRPNLNSLGPEAAPVIAAIGAVPLATARDAIAARPPGGWSDAAAFWAQPLLAGRPIAADALRQPDVRDRFVAYRMAATTDGTSLVQTGLIDAARRPARLVVRRYGDEN